MTPRDVDELSDVELDAFERYMRDEIRAIRKAQARAGRRR